ncbi:hypothetical protein SDJN02_11265, partial [Cucurbita argyrosperma subsp. argyrosperma]
MESDNQSGMHGDLDKHHHLDTWLLVSRFSLCDRVKNSPDLWIKKSAEERKEKNLVPVSGCELLCEATDKSQNEPIEPRSVLHPSSVLLPPPPVLQFLCYVSKRLQLDTFQPHFFHKTSTVNVDLNYKYLGDDKTSQKSSRDCSLWALKQKKLLTVQEESELIVQIQQPVWGYHDTTFQEITANFEVKAHSEALCILDPNERQIIN